MTGANAVPGALAMLDLLDLLDFILKCYAPFPAHSEQAVRSQESGLRYLKDSVAKRYFILCITYCEYP